MSDPYLQPDSRVLRNLFNITDSNELDLAEAELSRASMMLLYEQGFDDFSAKGIQFLHEAMFGDVYDWAGQFTSRSVSRFWQASVFGIPIQTRFNTIWVLHGNQYIPLLGINYPKPSLPNSSSGHSLPFGRFIRSERATHARLLC